MNVSFEGFKNPNGDVEKLLRYVITYCESKLWDPGDADDVSLRVVILDNIKLNETTNTLELHADNSYTDVVGALFPAGEEFNTEFDRHFNLGVWYKLEPGELFLAICHEMVHLFQYVTNMLITTCNSVEGITNWWEGEKIDPEIEYQLLPWEIHAYEHDTWLLDQLVQDQEFLTMCKMIAETRLKI